MSRMCACLRKLQCFTNGHSPEVNRCQKLKVRYDIPKHPVYVLKSPWKGQQCPLEPLLCCAHYHTQNIESALAIT